MPRSPTPPSRLKKDELSKPVEGQFAVVLVRVSEIVPGKQRTYEEVKDEISDRLAEERANQEIQTLHDKVESERSAGKSLKEIGEQLKLHFREIAEIDRARQDRSTASRPSRARGGEGGARQRSPVPGHRGRSDRAGRRRLRLGRRDRRHAGEAEELRRSQGRGHGAAVEDGQRRNEIAALAAKLVERLAQGRDAGRRRQGDRRQGAKRPTPITRSTSPRG